MGSTLTAGFFRRSVFEMIGGLHCAFGEELADVDWAAKLCAQDLRCQVEPNCILVSAAERKTNLGFQIGRNLERLYRNYATSGYGGFFSHAFQIAMHTGLHIFHPAIIATLLGRFVGLVERKNTRLTKISEAEFLTTNEPLPTLIKTRTRSRAA